MATILYVSTDNIRSALGLSEQDMSDAQIVSAQVEDQILVALEGVYPGHEALHDAQSGSPTAEQVKLYRVLKLYMQFQGAVCLLPSLQLAAAQKVTDGDVEMQRFMKDNLQETKQEILGKRDEYSAVLQAAADIESASAAPLSLMGRSTPTYDPVTNEGAA